MNRNLPSEEDDSWKRGWQRLRVKGRQASLGNSGWLESLRTEFGERYAWRGSVYILS